MKQIKDLTDAYENGAYIPDADLYRGNWPVQAKAFRDATRAVLDIKYRASSRQRFDLFLPKSEPIGLIVYIHGGYWRMTSKNEWSHLASGAVARGWAVAMPSYTLAPEARISEITQEVAIAIARASREVSGPIVITGHSAGGHLAARMRCKGTLHEAVAKRVMYIVPISPLSDLRPLMQTKMNEDLQLDEKEARAESPQLINDLWKIDTEVWVGAEERAAFLDQARWLSAAWKCRLKIAPGRHHFDMVDLMQTADGPLTESLVSRVT